MWSLATAWCSDCTKHVAYCDVAWSKHAAQRQTNKVGLSIRTAAVALCRLSLAIRSENPRFPWDCSTHSHNEQDICHILHRPVGFDCVALCTGSSDKRDPMTSLRRSVHTGFLVDKVRVGQIFLRVLRYAAVSTIQTLLHTQVHLNITVIRRTSGRSLRKLLESNATSDIGEQRT